MPRHEQSPQARAFRRMPLAAMGAQVMLDQWRRVASFEPGVRAGTDDEDLHKMRVATRRFRAAADVFGKAIDLAAGAPVVTLAADVAVLAAALGRVRDRDVFVAYLGAQAEEAVQGDRATIERLIEWRLDERAVAREALFAALDGEAMRRLRERVEPALGPITAPVLARPLDRFPDRLRVGRRVPVLIAKQVRRLRRRAQSTVAPLPADLHRVRIAAKKLRYAAEFFAPGFPSLLPPLAELATGIQDALGEAHDLDTLGATLVADLERLASEPDQPADAAAIARLLRHNAERRDAALVRFRSIWSGLPTPGAIRKRLRAAA